MVSGGAGAWVGAGDVGACVLEACVGRGVVVLIVEGTVGEEVICGLGLQAEKTIKINKEIKRVLDLVSIFLSIQTRKTAQLEAAPCRRNYKGLCSCGVDFTRPFIDRSSCPERYSGRW